MKLIPEDVRYARRCYFCHTTHDKSNPVAYQLDIEETRIPEEEWKFLSGGVYCCRECLEKEWMST